jgi:hypothetical protein
MNELKTLTVAEALPEKALSSAAAAEAKRWSFILIYEKHVLSSK